MKKIIFCMVLCELLLVTGCSLNSATSAQTNRVNMSTVAQSNSSFNSNMYGTEFDGNTNSPILYGSFSLRDWEKNSPSAIKVQVDKEVVENTRGLGVNFKLPANGTTVKMDVMNCSGYLGTAVVTYHGLQISEVWTAWLITETVPPDLEKQMLRCVETPNDKFTRDNLWNSVFFIAPTDEKRKQIQNVKSPDWKEIVSTVPYEWRKIARLPKFPTRKQAEQCIGDWLDSDGDGKVDLITLCAFNEDSITESGNIWQYSRVLQMVNGRWRELWRTADTKD